VKRVPVKLAQDLIVEAIFEIRFVGKVPSVSDLLPGLLYPRFRDRYQNPERLPFSEFPREIQEADPTFRYQPRLRIAGEQTAILLGDRSAIVNCPKPYIGWSKYRALILEVIGALHETDLITSVERYSVKYLNVIPGPTFQEQLKAVNFSAHLGNYKLTEWPTSVRTEIKEDGLINIVEVQPNSVITNRQKESFRGLLVTVDTIAQGTDNFWANPETNIDKIHTKEKEIFFDLLTRETIEKCGPVWE